MRAIVITLFLLYSVAEVQAQNTEKELIKNTEAAVKNINDTLPNGWRKKGNIAFLWVT